jgi:hypothetical protein
VKKNKRCLILLVVTLVVYFPLVKYKIMDLSFVNANNFNIITVDAIFAGFLFTSLALIVGLAGDKILVRLERADFMDDIYSHISVGLLFSLISIIITVFNAFIAASLIKNMHVKNKMVLDFINNTIPAAELYFLILTIIMFSFSALDIRFIIIAIRNHIRNQFPNKSDIEETLKKIKV